MRRKLEERRGSGGESVWIGRGGFAEKRKMDVEVWKRRNLVKEVE